MRTRLLLLLAAGLALLTGLVLLRSDSTVRAQTSAQPAVPTPIGPVGPLPIPTVLPPRPERPPLPVQLERVGVNVEINDVIATTSMDLVFRNNTDRPQEGTLLLPVPAGAAIGDFTMTVDGQTLEGEILGRDEAVRVYTRIVQQLRDPALLEYAGSNVLRARVFPVPPRGESTLTVRFSQILPLENSTLRYRLPLGASAEISTTVAALNINVRVRSESRGVRSLFSPSHTLKVETVSPNELLASYEGTNVPARGTFDLTALLSGDDVAAGLVAYRNPGEDGFFMLWLSPALGEEQVVEKDVVLVIDTSGSMAGVKMEQAKNAASFVLNSLNPGDRYGIVAFSSTVDRFDARLRPATDNAQGLAYVDRLRAEGGTNINDALLMALRYADSARPMTILFLTDGQATSGVQDTGRILANVHDSAAGNVRLFVFGVGNDVNTVLLDSLATGNRGDVQYVRPQEDVEEAVGTLYQRIRSPQLTDLHLDFGEALVHDVYPSPLPDLFGGQTLFVFGRYRDTQTLDVTLTGNTAQGPREFRFPGMQLATGDRQASYVPFLWAGRKVAALLREIRLQGPANSREQIDEVVALATRYGILTEYTAFLVLEPGAVPPQEAVARAAAAPVSGADATGAAAQVGQVAAATPAPQPTAVPANLAAPQGTGPGAPAADVAREIRYVGDKSFVLRDGVWTDTAYQVGTETVKVAFASDAYFDLLGRVPELAPFFALGERVIVVIGDTVYEVTSG